MNGLGQPDEFISATYAWQGPRALPQEAGPDSFNARRKDEAGPEPFSLIRGEGGVGDGGSSLPTCFLYASDGSKYFTYLNLFVPRHKPTRHCHRSQVIAKQPEAQRG